MSLVFVLRGFCLPDPVAAWHSCLNLQWLLGIPASTIYAAKPTTDELSSVLNQELQAIVEWITNNKLVLNISKTNSIVFGSKTMLMNEPKLKLYVNDVAVEQVQETKLLGILFDSKLTWSKHIEKVINKMGRSLSIIRRCCDFLPLYLRGSVIKSLVLSHLDYCSEVWSCAATSSIKKLQIAQNKAA